jgi:plastocyanin
MRFSIRTALAFAFVGPAVAEPGVSPASVNKASDPNSSFNINKVVTTPEILPKPDIVLLVDVTASMTGTIDNIKTNLDTVISSVDGGQPNAQFAVVSFGDLRDPNGFQVVQGLTDNAAAVQNAVNSLTAAFGQDIPEDWISALYTISTGAISFRDDSSRIIVLVSDANSHDPSGGHTLSDAINALNAKNIRVIGVNVGALDSEGQASAVTTATGGIIIGSAADEVSNAIISGLKNIDITVTPDVVSCDAGLAIEFNPSSIHVSSGTTVTFQETVKVADNAAQATTLTCSVRFLLNGAPGGATFVQTVSVPVNQLGCFLCNPQPGKNLCHITTSCAPTPFGTMCLTRPGYKADGAADDNVKLQWRLQWPVPGHEHRVAVKPGTSSDTLCSSAHTGNDVCQEVVVAKCSAAALEGMNGENTQKVLGAGEL